MAKRWPCPEGVSCSARTDAIGVVAEQAIEAFSPLLRNTLAHAILQIGDYDLDISAVGEIAIALASIPAGTALSVSGDLVLDAKGYCVNVTRMERIGRWTTN
jgi:post-segregation antitoxin (ccd killing protein)